MDKMSRVTKRAWVKVVLAGLIWGVLGGPILGEGQQAKARVLSPEGGNKKGQDVNVLAEPKTRVSEGVVEEFHGQKVQDPFRWLEGDEKGKSTAEVLEWTEAHNARTRAILGGVEGREKIEARMRALIEPGSTSLPRMAGENYFFTRRKGNQKQPILYLRNKDNIGTAGLEADRKLIDPMELDPSGLTTLAFYTPSQDGKLLAFGTYKAGDENTTLYLMDVATGSWLADEIPGKAGSVTWMPDGKHFVYRRLADIKDPYSAEIRLHRIGRHWTQDPILMVQDKEGPLAKTWGPGAGVSRDGKWLVMSYWTSTRSNDLWIADFQAYLKTGKLDKKTIAQGLNATFGADVVDDMVYVQTTHEAPRGRVIALPADAPVLAEAKTIVPEPENGVLESVSVAGEFLVAQYQQDSTTRVKKLDKTGKELGEVKLPGIGTAGLSTDDDRTEIFFSFTSYNSPGTIYRSDLKLADKEGGVVWFRPEVPFESESVVVSQVFYPSKDGTKVPMFVVHKAGLVPEGTHPALLYGYGGFNNAMTPFFWSTKLPFIEAGGVLAVAGIRGGSEYGDEWHRAGMLEQKQNTFDDFIAAGEWLIANKYASPKRLACEGGSNGGLLTGAVLTQRPELFAAVVSRVPLLDMLRYERFLMAQYWVPEYGTAQNAEQFGFIRAYSPYHNVDEKKVYPPVLLTAGENDTRVHPLHARKMAARLQQAVDVSGGGPILLWVNMKSGHGGGRPIDTIIQEEADVLSFYFKYLGMKVD